jgi:hypothetical protein
VPDQRPTTVVAGDGANGPSTASARGVGSALILNLTSSLFNTGQKAAHLWHLRLLETEGTAWEPLIRRPSHVGAPFVLQGRTHAEPADSPGRAAHV